MTHPLSEHARQRLLEIARRSAEAAVRRQPPPAFQVEEPELQAQRGAFVTLKNQGRLRGCIGQFTAKEPLWKVVAAMARSAATEDFRFFAQPVTEDELPQLSIEISVLSPMEKLENPLDLQLGTHGIYIVGPGGRGGTFLPQVATEHGMSKEQFLSTCCAHKAGLGPDAWRTGEAEVYVYTAEVFGEE
ncbi:MAG: AmmeMemoRadiSam system protein A [Candidatus Brocadiia bacterium]